MPTLVASLTLLYVYLANRVELVAVRAFMKVVLRVFEEKLQFNHEETRYELVLALLSLVKVLDWDPTGELANDWSVDATSVYLHASNLGEVLHEKINCVRHDRLEAEELSRYEKRHHRSIIDMWF